MNFELARKIVVIFHHPASLSIWADTACTSNAPGLNPRKALRQLFWIRVLSAPCWTGVMCFPRWHASPEFVRTTGAGMDGATQVLGPERPTVSPRICTVCWKNLTNSRLTFLWAIRSVDSARGLTLNDTPAKSRGSFWSIRRTLSNGSLSPGKSAPDSFYCGGRYRSVCRAGGVGAEVIRKRRPLSRARLDISAATTNSGKLCRSTWRTPASFLLWAQLRSWWFLGTRTDGRQRITNRNGRSGSRISPVFLQTPAS